MAVAENGGEGCLLGLRILAGEEILHLDSHRPVLLVGVECVVLFGVLCGGVAEVEVAGLRFGRIRGVVVLVPVVFKVGVHLGGVLEVGVVIHGTIGDSLRSGRDGYGRGNHCQQGCTESRGKVEFHDVRLVIKYFAAVAAHCTLYQMPPAMARSK